MRDVSEAFLAQVVADTPTVSSTVAISDPTASGETTLHTEGGHVEDDRTRAIRRTCTLPCPPDLSPQDADDLTAPFGNEVRLARGFVLSDGTVEEAPQGMFRLDGYDEEQGDDGIRCILRGSDRASVIADNVWTDTKVVPAGGQLDAVLADLAADRYPDVQVNLPSMEATVPRVVWDIGDDPWDGMRKLAKSAGWELFFDGEGRLAAEKPRTFDDDPDIVYLGGRQAILLQASRGANVRASVFSGVVGVSSGTGLNVPLRSEIWDDDPDSPTYRLKKFGARAEPFRTSTALTQSALDSAVQARWDLIRGAVEQVQFTTIVNPAQRSGDVIAVTADQLDVGVDLVRMVLDKITIPIGPTEPMASSGRRRFL